MREAGRINECVDERRYGKYRAFVIDNADPEKRGRLRLHIPSILGCAETGWALPCFPFGGGSSYGSFAVPEADAQVWAEFEEGDINRPIWTGGFWAKAEDVPEEAAKQPPTTRLFKTPSGQLMEFNDEEGEETFCLFHPSEAELSIDKDGSFLLLDSSGASLTLDAKGKKVIVEDANNNTLIMDSSGISVEDGNGNKIDITASGISVEGQQVVLKGAQVVLGGEGGEPVIKGMGFMSFFNTHTHTAPGGMAPAPTTPPLVPMSAAQLSTKVTST